MISALISINGKDVASVDISRAHQNLPAGDSGVDLESEYLYDAVIDQGLGAPIRGYTVAHRYGDGALELLRKVLDINHRTTTSGETE